MDCSKIIVVGSANMDMVVKANHIPAPGETVIADAFFMNPGGKGANQAIAIARFANTHYFTGGYLPLGYIGVQEKITNFKIAEHLFSDIQSDTTLYYKRP